MFKEIGRVTELLKYLTAHKNDDYIEDLEVKGEQ